MTMVYGFRRAAVVPKGVDAELTAKELDRIHVQYGKLTPKTIADDVESETAGHPLEQWFTWDAGVAMRRLHEKEAGDLLRVVTVQHVMPTQSEPVRAYVVVSSNGESSYEPIAVALRSTDKRQQLLGQVRKEKQAFDDKLDELLALVELMMGEAYARRGEARHGAAR